MNPVLKADFAAVARRLSLRRLSLRWRLSAAFGLGLLVVVSLLAVATWNLSTGYMLDQRERSATRQAEINARLMERAIQAEPGSLDELLAGLTTGPDSTIMLRREGQWLTSGRQVALSSLPRSLLAFADRGSPARQRFISDGIPVLAVTLPAAGADAYVELSPLLELDKTFRYLSALLIAGSVTCALFGVPLGVWASRRALRPLTALNTAALKVAAGDLGARLPRQADPDLTPLAETFNATAEALEQRVKRDARFATDVSHELRSPLTTMVNVAGVLERRQDMLPEPSRQALTLLLTEIHRFQRMVVDLLEISSADQQEEMHPLELVDLADLVRHVVARKTSSTVPIEVGEPPPLANVDRRRLDRVVENLLDNAERYGGGPVRVGVFLVDGMARMEIDDSGPGVPKELREQIFERFARGAHSGRRGSGTGNGLGLAIVADHVRRHHGTVWVEDRPGGGARFVVELPEAAS